MYDFFYFLRLAYKTVNKKFFKIILSLEENWHEAWGVDSNLGSCLLKHSDPFVSSESITRVSIASCIDKIDPALYPKVNDAQLARLIVEPISIVEWTLLLPITIPIAIFNGGRALFNGISTFLNYYPLAQGIGIFLPTVFESLYSTGKLAIRGRADLGNIQFFFEIFHLFINACVLVVSLYCYIQGEPFLGYHPTELLLSISAASSLRSFIMGCGRQGIDFYNLVRPTLVNILRLIGGGSEGYGFLGKNDLPSRLLNFQESYERIGKAKIVEPSIVWKAIEFTPLANQRMIDNVFDFYKTLQ